ncbi:hypothetical protein N480_21260 [Pseudoalteromonas luteoviolacea S2607]|uniref:hypothetical protein n=1 Tax=Pseudoalteromonas luteoviolacea TaxID=43657 RepID=UPI0007B04369|nr:hypothetical protein [Pseudoalteromonas luteoviolacea]KZN34556.1 hypothetical protein N480_21260 [Pseudoalteromonas luteoviolacea S2607]
MKIKAKTLSTIVAALIGTASINAFSADKPLYRGYKHGNHFYTTDVVEMLNAKASGGYEYQGVTVTLVEYGDADAHKAFYRLYNKDAGPAGNHFYTTDVVEALNIKSLGYVYEKSEGYTTKSTAKTIYRGYHSELDNHFYTTDVVEMLNATASGGYIYQKEEGHGK